MSNSAVKKDHSSNPFFNNERNAFLREFIDSQRGNGSALSKIVFGKSNVGFSIFKSGKTKVYDSLWNKIVKGVDHINNNEKNTFKTSSIYIELFINDWLKTNSKVKLRLANVVYSLNYTKTKTLTSRKFASLVRNKKINQTEWEKIVTTIGKVNEMIANKNRFVLSAASVV